MRAAQNWKDGRNPKPKPPARPATKSTRPLAINCSKPITASGLKRPLKSPAGYNGKENHSPRTRAASAIIQGQATASSTPVPTAARFTAALKERPPISPLFLPTRATMAAMWARVKTTSNPRANCQHPKASMKQSSGTSRPSQHPLPKLWENPRSSVMVKRKIAVRPIAGTMEGTRLSCHNARRNTPICSSSPGKPQTLRVR